VQLYGVGTGVVDHVIVGKVGAAFEFVHNERAIWRVIGAGADYVGAGIDSGFVKKGQLQVVGSVGGAAGGGYGERIIGGGIVVARAVDGVESFICAVDSGGNTEGDDGRRNVIGFCGGFFGAG